MSAHENGIPKVLAAAWGLKERPGKGPRPGLTLDRIVAAGVKVAATEGLGAVSMARVAGELGAATMSLYRYVSAKNELLDLMVDAAIGPAPETDPSLGWREGLRGFAYSYLALLRRQSWVVRVPISTPPITPHQIGWMNHGLAVMRETNLRHDERLSTIMMVSGMARNWALLTADIDAAAHAAGGTTEQAMSEYGRLLYTLVDPVRFPAIGELIESRVLETSSARPDDDFEFGIERFLDGLDALMQRRK
ncbi:TetR/AcrR family transcriptional regulator C-terminal domain-containing protein [Dactylosporangium vinaceum]|uniref:TetR/AcrR family transcriptional regulator n=1 Tax=Dactylosporangium vinaceum TaxID=53362 RepID=A0ABV5MB28_9ACTN|nr:TetR/AcrR family transcriptional regulator [Dactylosporangium vinaceum]UAB98281.1 TetR/AcrR family transcriptional regulator C-terminal domain-containing protein [Dactylosporangium vinaceum]